MRCPMCNITENVRKENANYCPKCGKLLRVISKIIEYKVIDGEGEKK